MTLKVHLPSGAFLCPKCGTPLKEEDSKCPKCGENFEGVREGKKCPSCGSINDADAVICSSCGYSFGTPRERAMGDEEFLQKLLNWSKTLAEEENKDYKEEADMVATVFKKVTGIQLDETEDSEGDEDWGKRIERNNRFLASVIALLEEEKKSVEKKLSNARKKETKSMLEDDLKAIELEIKGLKRIEMDLVDMKKWFEDRLSRAEDEKIEKERELRREIANVRKGSIKREEELREHINTLSSELESLRNRMSENASAKSLVEDWTTVEKRLEKEIERLGKKEKEEKVREFIYSMKKEAETILLALKLHTEEEDELRHLLGVLDNLLENLPSKKIEEFAKSEDFRLYERVLDRYHVGE